MRHMRHRSAAPVAQRHGRAAHGSASADVQGSRCWHAERLTILLVTLLATTGCCHAATARQLVAAATHQHQDLKSQDAGDVLGTSLLKDAGWLEERPTSCSNRVCSRYHTQRAQALECRMLPVPAWWHKAPITAELCHLPGGEVLLTVVTPSDMRAMLYAQLAGPQVMALPITGCNLAGADGSSTDVSHQLWNQNAVASGKGGVLALQLLVTDVVPGDYELSVFLTSVSPTYSGKDVKVEGVCGEPLWRLPLHITSASTCTYCAPKPQQWPVCRVPYMEGTVMCASQQEAGMQLTSKPAHSPGGWQSLIRWQPKGCNFMPRQKIDLTTCFIERLVCFVGDAHARNAHEGVADALVAARVRSTGSKDTTLATIFAHQKSRLVWEASGDLWHAEYSQQLDGCTDVVMALPSGKDASRWQAGNHAFTLTKAFQVMRRLKAAQPSRRFYFMTPPTYAPSCSSASDVKPALSPAVVNELGVMLAGWHHIPVINAVAITAPLITSPDVDSAALNHPYLGFVGQTVTDYILNVLCVQPQQ